MKKAKIILALNELSLKLQKSGYLISIDEIQERDRSVITVKVIDRNNEEVEIEKKFVEYFDDQDSLKNAIDLIYEVGFLMGNQK